MITLSNTGICPDDKKHYDISIPVRYGIKNSQVDARLILDDHDVDCIKVFINGDHNDFKRNKKGVFEPIHLSKDIHPEVLLAINQQLNTMFR